MSDIPLKIQVCVCTFRRQHIARTLESLSKQIINPDWILQVIVADNDEVPSARELVLATAQQYGLTINYIHAPARNISIARNACLDAATAPLIAFVDDDEIVTPYWLHHMLAQLEQGNFDVVAGPMEAIYPADCPGWIRKGDFHSSRIKPFNGKINVAYTCNVLMRRNCEAFRNLRFREELGRSGGEDRVFFSAAYKAGARMGYAPKAIVTTVIAPERLQLIWLLKRRFRAGQTQDFIALQNGYMGLGGRFGKAFIALSRALVCLVIALIMIMHAELSVYWLLRAAMRMGMAARLLGKRELILYG